MKFKAKVREQKTNMGKKPFGKITSLELGGFIGKDVEIEVTELIVISK